MEVGLPCRVRVFTDGSKTQDGVVAEARLNDNNEIGFSCPALVNIYGKAPLYPVGCLHYSGAAE